MAAKSGSGIWRCGRVLAVLAAVTMGQGGSAAGAPRLTILAGSAPAAELLRATVAASPTAAALVDDLRGNGTVIVVVELTRERFEAVGDLRLQAVAGGVRYLRLRVFAGLERWEQMATLGHELQHAREVALAPEVLYAPGLADLMRRIGREAYRDRFETAAAIEAGTRVRHEVAHGTSCSGRLRRPCRTR